MKVSHLADHWTGFTPFLMRKKRSKSLPLSGILLATIAAHGANISVPNYSFELQLAAPPFYADPRIDSWQKAPRPAYFDEGAFQITWDQTAGVFLDNFVGNPSPLANR